MHYGLILKNISRLIVQIGRVKALFQERSIISLQFGICPRAKSGRFSKNILGVATQLQP